MSREQSDGEDSLVETEVVPVDDETTETEVEFRQPRATDPVLDQMPKDIPVVTGAVGAEADTSDPGQTRRLGPLSGAKPKRPRFELPIQQTPGSRRPPPDTGTQPVKLVTDRFTFEMPTPTYPGPDRQPPGAGTQPVKPVTNWFTFEMPYPGPGRQLPGAGTQPMTDRFMYKLPPWIRTPPMLDRLGDDLSDMPNLRHDELPPKAEGYDSIRSPEADLMDTVAHLQLDVEAEVDRPVRIRNAEPAVSRTELAAAGCWDTAGEAGD